MSFWDTVTSVARGVLQDALAGAPPATLVTALARTNIERARAELRLGDQGAGDSLLASTRSRLEDLADEAKAGSPDATKSADQVHLLRAIALSVSGQGLERRGQAAQARELYTRAVELFAQVPDDQLLPRDRSDYGVALAALGRDEARAYLERARAEDGGTPEAARHLARLLLDSGETGEAERLLDEALQVAPTDADAYLLLGRAQRQRGHSAAPVTYQQAAYLFLQADRPTDAREALETAGDLVGDRRGMLGLHAEALRLEGRYQEAADEFRQALDRDTDSPWLMGRLGAAEAALGRIEEARSHLERAAALAPKDASILLLAGEVALAGGDLDAAFAYADRAAQADPRRADAYGLRARVARARGSLDEALEAVRAGRALAPHDAGLLRLHVALEKAADNLDAAVDLLQTVRNLPGATPADHAEYADLLAASDRLPDAVAAAAQAVRHWPDDADLAELYGDLLRRNGEPGESLPVLRRAVQLNPRSARAKLLVALALSELPTPGEDDEDEAFRALAESIELQPEWADPYWIRAVLLARRGAVVAAEQDVEMALKCDPDHPDALELMAELRLRKGDTQGAMKIARRLADRRPRQGRHLLLLARVYYQQGVPRRSLKVLTDQPADVVRDPELRTRWLLLRGQVNTDLHRWEKAERDLAAVCELQPDLVDGWFWRGELARLRGAAPQALEYSTRTLDLKDDFVEAWALHGAALMSLGRTDEAKRALERALRLDGDYVFALRLLAQLTGLDDPERARALLDKAIAEAPHDRDLQIERAWLAITTVEYDKALTQFERLLEEERDAEALAGKAEALRLQDRAEEAIEAAEQALALVPDHADALRSLGFALLGTNDQGRAIEVFNQALQIYPDDIHAKADLGYASAVSENIDQALALLDEACVAAPRDRWALVQLGQVLTTIGSFDDAAEVLRRVADADENDMTAWETLGWALLFVDPPRLDEARTAWEHAAQLDRDNPWLQKGIADALHLKGETEAAAQLYGAARQQVEAMRNEQMNEQKEVLPLIGWCAFRMSDFVTASRAFSEAVSVAPLPDSDQFDLALTIFCKGRLSRGVDQYETAIELVGPRHALVRRGLVTVAIMDFRQALRDHPQLDGTSEAAAVTELLTTTLEALPVPARPEALRVPADA